MRLNILFTVLCLSFIFSLSSQNQIKLNFNNEFNFLIHLSKNKLFDEAEVIKSRLFKSSEITQAYKDSINFLLASAYYNTQQPFKAKPLFLNVSDEPFFYYKSRYIAGLIDIELGKVDSAYINYTNIEESTNSDLNELKKFEVLGLTLLKKKYVSFDSLSNQFQFNNPILNEEFLSLKKYRTIDEKIKRKSPLLAGTLSAIIPGLGKVYAGNNGQALASFLTCGLMGGIVVENYFRLGMYHPQTIFFTGIFSLFYIGNIYGSALSVQIVKTEKQLENKHNILVGIKLPITKFFN
jgi:hypothetical protein